MPVSRRSDGAAGASPSPSGTSSGRSARGFGSVDARSPSHRADTSGGGSTPRLVGAGGRPNPAKRSSGTSGMRDTLRSEHGTVPSRSCYDEERQRSTFDQD